MSVEKGGKEKKERKENLHLMVSTFIIRIYFSFKELEWEGAYGHWLEIWELGPAKMVRVYAYTYAWGNFVPMWQG